MFIKLPYVSIKPNYFTTYIHHDCTNDHSFKRYENFIQPLSNVSHGIMSNKANKRVRLAIDWLCHISKDKVLEKKGVKTNYKFKLNFITLTLSSKQRHSDNTIKSVLLNQFLTELRTKYKCSNYLWRAEAQRNGNIHFHVCTDVFVPWRALRTDWNRIQEKLGYVSEFTNRTGKHDPNSTDVHAINQIKNLPAYLAKYCTKNSKGYVVMATMATTVPFRPSCFLTYVHPVLKTKATFYRQIHGKLWGLSQSLSSLKSATKEVANRIAEEIEYLKNTFKTRVRYVDRACVFFFNIAELLSLKCEALARTFDAYKESVLNPKEPDIPVFLHVVQSPIRVPVFTQSKINF